VLEGVSGDLGDELLVGCVGFGAQVLGGGEVGGVVDGDAVAEGVGYCVLRYVGEWDGWELVVDEVGGGSL